MASWWEQWLANLQRTPEEMILNLLRRIEKNNEYMAMYHDNEMVQAYFTAGNVRIMDTIKYIETLEKGKKYDCRNNPSTGMKVSACY